MTGIYPARPYVIGSWQTEEGVRTLLGVFSPQTEAPTMRRLWTDEAGQDMAEYALLLGLIALAIVVAVVAFRDAIHSKFLAAANLLNGSGS